MDLRLNSETARGAVIWILNGIGVLLLLWATATYGKSSSTGKDYLYPNESAGGYLSQSDRTESSFGRTEKAAPLQYVAFDGSSHGLREHRGRHVNVLLPESTVVEPYFTADHIDELVDRLDLLYVLYRELMQFEPSGSGLLNVAFVPETCGMGCGLLGAKGIEILSHPLNYENIIRELDAGRLERILVHEMVHNFDGYARYLHYLPDHAHAWTDMFEYFAPYRYARETLNNQAPDDIYNSPVSAVWKDYVSDQSADWETCVRDQSCEENGLTANNLWAMLYYRMESLYGTGAMIDSFEFLAEYRSNNPAPRSDEEKEGLRILSLAVGAGANISCYMDSLRWPVPAAARTEMERRFGGTQEFCTDIDGDGFTAINGDCDDTDPARNILSVEIMGNGLDDDCDDLVDEISLVESEYGKEPDNFVKTVSAGIPMEVEGSASDSEDRDTFSFSLEQFNRARVTLCADDGFTGWAVALQPDGSFLNAPNWNAYQPWAGCTSNTFDYGKFDEGGIMVIPDESQGRYSLTVSEGTALPPDLSTYLEAIPLGNGSVMLQVNDRDGVLLGLGADEIEFWVSGAGVQVFRPFAQTAKAYLSSSSLPGLVDGQHYQVRMRPRADGNPLAAFSAGKLFRYEAGTLAVSALDSGFSGLWYDPDHDGEGFLVEILDQGRALVYWFTYHTDGRQRWFIGVGEIRDNRIVIDELLDSGGGRFGQDFDPDQVILTDRGSLSISFVSCSEALANFSVDNVGGNLPLKRLTQVKGHHCGFENEPEAPDISGSWYDPSHDGEGFVVEQLDDKEALVFYFTYDDSGNQTWLFNTGAIQGNRLSFPDLLRPEGGIFGRSFDPESVLLEPWGELTLDLDCSGGEAHYAPSQPAYSNGSQNLTRLTFLQNSGCAE